jgi:four helix bundle protein
LEDVEQSPIRSYEDLIVYQRGMAMLSRIHKLVLTFPDYEKYDLADQMRRASKSVPTNIAEGYAKKRFPKVFRNHLIVAMGSANEMVVHLKVARELGYVSQRECDECASEYEIIGKQLNRLASSWRDLTGRAVPTSNLQRRGDQP